MVLVSFSTPLPSTSTACGTCEGFEKLIVTLPALALIDFVSNWSAPLEGALSLTELLPPAAAPPELALVVVFEDVLDVVLLLLEPPLSSSPPPQPAAANASAASTATGARKRVRMAGGTQPRRPRFSSEAYRA
jgi:hypothetical protein